MSNIFCVLFVTFPQPHLSQRSERSEPFHEPDGTPSGLRGREPRGGRRTNGATTTILTVVYELGWRSSPVGGILGGWTSAKSKPYGRTQTVKPSLMVFAYALYAS
jgi:hypothetical protein